MFGQVGFFNKFAGKAYEDKRPRDRYATKSTRLLSVLDKRLAARDWVMGADYSIADISLLGWVRSLIGFYEARELVGFDRFLHVQAWLNRGLARLGTILLLSLGMSLAIAPLTALLPPSSRIAPESRPASTARSRAPGRFSPSPCSAASCSKAVLSCFLDYPWLSPRAPAFSPRSSCSSSSRGPRRLLPARLIRSVSVVIGPARPGGNNEERRPT